MTTQAARQETFFYPLQAALELVGLLLQRGRRGAPSTWSLRMTMVAVLVPFVILAVHPWDGDVVRMAGQSTNIFMVILRHSTNPAAAQVWLALSILVWLATAFMLAPSGAGSTRRKMPDALLRWHGWATFMIVAIVAGSIPVEIGKHLVGRARPPLLDQLGAAYFAPFHGGFLYESFPSGHAMTAGIVTVALWIFLPRWRIAAIVVPVLFCLSRLAANAHFPTDVIGGFAIGFIVAWWVARYMATRNIIFFMDNKSAFPSA